MSPRRRQMKWMKRSFVRSDMIHSSTGSNPHISSKKGALSITKSQISRFLIGAWKIGHCFMKLWWCICFPSLLYLLQLWKKSRTNHIEWRWIWLRLDRWILTGRRPVHSFYRKTEFRRRIKMISTASFEKLRYIAKIWKELAKTNALYLCWANSASSVSSHKHKCNAFK